jgi:hypothetical protein
VGLGLDHLIVHQHGLTQASQANAKTPAFEQRRPQLLLESSYAFRQCGLRDVEFLRSRSQVAQACRG